MSTQTGKQSTFSQSTGSHNTADNRAPVELVFEEKTPFIRWIIIGVAALFVCGILTFMINAGNPKITASALASITPQTVPTSTPTTNEAGYSAQVAIFPTGRVPTNSTITLTSTLLLNGQPVEGAVVNYTLLNTRGVLRELKGSNTDANGVEVTQYNIARIFGDFETKVTVVFLIDGKIVANTKGSFTPVTK